MPITSTHHIDGLAPDGSNSSTLTMGLLHSCAKPLICSWLRIMTHKLILHLVLVLLKISFYIYIFHAIHLFMIFMVILPIYSDCSLSVAQTCAICAKTVATTKMPQSLIRNIVFWNSCRFDITDIVTVITKFNMLGQHWSYYLRMNGSPSQYKGRPSQ